MNFSDNLRTARLTAGYKSAKEFAQLLDIPYSTYLAYESGREPNYELLCQICRLTGTTPNLLMDFGTNDNTAAKIKALSDAGIKITVLDDGSNPIDSFDGHTFIEGSSDAVIGIKIHDADTFVYRLDNIAEKDKIIDELAEILKRAKHEMLKQKDLYHDIVVATLRVFYINLANRFRETHTPDYMGDLLYRLSHFIDKIAKQDSLYDALLNYSNTEPMTEEEAAIDLLKSYGDEDAEKHAAEFYSLDILLGAPKLWEIAGQDIKKFLLFLNEETLKRLTDEEYTKKLKINNQ